MTRGAAWILAVLLASCGGDPDGHDALPPFVAPAATPGELLSTIVATCAELEGSLEVRRHGVAHWDPAPVGTLFRDGDWIRSGAGSAARVRLAAGGHLELAEKTVVLVETAAQDAADGHAVRVSVASGSASGVLEGSSSSALLVAAGDQQVTRLAGAPGKAPVEFRLSAGGGGTDVVVNGERAGKGAHGAGPHAPRKPRPTLDFPESRSPGVDARFRCAPKLEIPLTWGAVAKAAGYRVVIARDMSFHSIALDVKVHGTTYRFKPPAPGIYAWRVAARGRDGRSGEYGFARRIFCQK